MKTLLALCALLLAAWACTLKPNDFPPPPTLPPEMTVIVEFPPSTSVPSTATPSSKLIMDEDMSNAENFFLILKTSAAAGDSEGIAQRVSYPINVKINGQMATLHNTNEFVDNYAQLFNETVLNALLTTNEADLSNLPGGIRVGNGELWFGLFCPDAACAEPVFLITQINN